MKLTPQQAARYFSKTLPDRLKREVIRAEKASLAAAKKSAIRWSSGPYKSDTLAKMDHPYATRHGYPKLKPSLINAQTGLFRSAWWENTPFWISSGTRMSLVNFAPYSGYMLGTYKMFPRPIWLRVQRDIGKLRHQRMEKAVTRALTHP